MASYDHQILSRILKGHTMLGQNNASPFQELIASIFVKITCSAAACLLPKIRRKNSTKNCIAVKNGDKNSIEAWQT